MNFVKTNSVIIYSILLISTLFSMSCKNKEKNQSINSNSKTELQKPNIVFLLADDMGYGELGCYGQKMIKTPVLDKLAEKGIRFTNFYAGAPVCAPSRGVLMTGIHAGKATVRGNYGLYEDGLWDKVALKKEEITLSEMLKKADYQTAFIGKWHLDIPDDVSTWAVNRGFDFSIQEQWSGKRPGSRKFDGLVHWLHNDKDSIRYEQDKYDCIDEFRTNFALDFLDKKKSDKPFFLFMSYRAPHGREQYTRNKELYKDKDWKNSERVHAAKITLLDRNIGRLLDKLKEIDALESTLIVFTSDNGPHNEGHDYEFFNSNAEFRGKKRDVYEGGLKVPLIVYWKNKIEGGKVMTNLSSFHDIMPTLAEVANVETPKQATGTSILPSLLGEKQKESKYVYSEIQISRAKMDALDGGLRQSTRFGKWKGVRYGYNNKIQLFNLEVDKEERMDIASQHPDIIAQIDKIFENEHVEVPYFPKKGMVK